jgi:hypothetical protein
MASIRLMNSQLQCITRTQKSPDYAGLLVESREVRIET